ncbi:MAG: hypothetical protein E2598_06435 [Sphingobium sp.]|nr:hypothetical protein [Sphingobium sp.]
MADFTFTVTSAGRAALINAENTGTAPVVISHCGVSASPLVPSPSALVLPGEIKRIDTLAGDVVADDTIHVIVRDESNAAYSLHSLALYLADGTLFGIYGQASPIMEKSSQAMLLLALNVQFADVNAASLTFGATNFLNPSATTEREGVVELATNTEAQAGADASRAVTPKTMRSAFMGWLNDRLGEGAPSEFVKGLLSIATPPLFRQAIGLGNVNNTSDALKPISNAVQTALGLKAAAERRITAGNGLTGGGDLWADRSIALATPGTITTGTTNAVTPDGHTHALNITKGAIGLGSVDNTSDALKPISNAVALALAGKMDASILSQLAKYADFAGENAPTGRKFLPGGVVFQWGPLSLAADSYATISFPIAMSYCGYAAVEGMGEVGDRGAANNNPRVYNWSGTIANIFNPQHALSARWFSIGYI